jgi:ATP-dependent Clp protease ATP-binding subunit ClpB
VSDFSQTVIIMTSNIGSEFFLDPNLTEEQAAEKALDKLRAKYRPEFLNRFAGQRNIICFNKLGKPTVIRIAERELGKVNEAVKNKGIQVSMDQKTISDVVDIYYNPANGARGITGFFETDVTPVIAETILRTPNDKGVMKAALDPETKQMVISPPAPAANENNFTAAPSPAAAFNAR